MIIFSVNHDADTAVVQIGDLRRLIVETITAYGLNIDLDDQGRAVRIEITNVEAGGVGAGEGSETPASAYQYAPGSRMDWNNPGGTGKR